MVGSAHALDEAARLLGNSVKRLDETHFVPLFLGIFAGILLGTTPIAVPGLPQPVRLGLAGGPLVVALLLGRAGHVGRLVWHMPLNANLASREFGIALFLAAVGLLARFVLGTNFTIITGVLAGSVTDPPALASATGMARSDAPTVAYATVYPLAMLLRIVIAQILTLLLCS